MDTWRTWELVLPRLERRHDVLAPTLPGHAGGSPLPPDVDDDAIVDMLERTLDEAGWATAHIAGNSLGGYLALRLAARGRARSVVAFAPAGGWAVGDPAFAAVLRMQADLHTQTRAAAAQAVLSAGTPTGRRAATRLLTVRYEHLPEDLVAHLTLGVAACDALPLIEAALRTGYSLDAAAVACPVRVVWGTDDVLLPWPSTAVRFREDWLPHADWVELDGVGHAPQLDVPLEAAELILGLTAA
ncbi:Putative aminoacrylate hydrolase RutD [Paraconexibacter sp. AEG42_29]|uniref:Aminoacrylate hydrolase RutD n=2 Tax=Paraconexibacter sp. AEG42_29 TaxID=2997339 RepID=A0AAU7ART0_9ACTN